MNAPHRRGVPSRLGRRAAKPAAQAIAACAWRARTIGQGRPGKIWVGRLRWKSTPSTADMTGVWVGSPTCSDAAGDQLFTSLPASARAKPSSTLREFVYTASYNAAGAHRAPNTSGKVLVSLAIPRIRRSGILEHTRSARGLTRPPPPANSRAGRRPLPPPPTGRPLRRRARDGQVARGNPCSDPTVAPSSAEKRRLRLEWRPLLLQCGNRGHIPRGALHRCRGSTSSKTVSLSSPPRSATARLLHPPR